MLTTVMNVKVYASFFWNETRRNNFVAVEIKETIGHKNLTRYKDKHSDL